MLYRILTELKNKDQVDSIVLRRFDGFLMLEGMGRYMGRPEPSLIVEVETEELDKIVATALQIKIHNDQKAVLIQQIPNHAWFV